MKTITEEIKTRALALKFDAVGIASAEVLKDAEENLKRWVTSGFHGEMNWMAETARERVDPAAFFPEAECVLIVAQNYFRSKENLQMPPEVGNVSIYARGRDYHKVVRNKLKKLLRWIISREPATKGRIFVDSFPIAEKPLAVRAGIGWIGKNSLLTIRGSGSYFFLGGILLNLPLTPDVPLNEDYCGTCNRCLQACPTDALIAPYQLDARRCISYLTIESEGEISPELRTRMGNHIFGCDICQAVCPWNRFARDTDETDFYSRFTEKDLLLGKLNSLSREEFERMFEGTPVRRGGYQRFRRNVEIAIANLLR